jgi:hypothetical protein
MLGLGTSLAWLCIVWRAPVGGLGALALIGWAIFARRRWQRLLKRDGSEPGAPEQIVWQRFSGSALIWGHMVFVLFNPKIDLHVTSFGAA